jgi:RNA polymerase sigma factor (TIGR02999 family)
MEDVTQLLSAWSQGDRAALDRLMPLVYEELRKLAHHYLQSERPGATLQPTALVHEACLRMVKQEPVDWQNRSHFFGVASRLIRQVLVDHARKRGAAKRGSGEVLLAFDESMGRTTLVDVDLIRLDDALTSLSRLDERQSRIIELRFFGGVSVEETALVMGVSDRTVKREWASAKAWLFRELARGGAG